MLEALESLHWDAFTQWLEDNNRLDRKVIDTLREKRQEVLIALREVKQNLLNSEAKIQELFVDLATLLADLNLSFIDSHRKVVRNLPFSNSGTSTYRWSGCYSTSSEGTGFLTGTCIWKLLMTC